MKQAGRTQLLIAFPQKVIYRCAEDIRKLRKQGNVRIGTVPFPFGNGFVGHTDLIRQLRLCHVSMKPQGADS